MTIFRLIAFLAVLSAFSLSAQTATSSKDQAPAHAVEPLIVDVHPAPYHAGLYYDNNISDQRYDLRNATMLDMIAIAYDRERDDATILGGPAWLELDRFNLAAKIESLKTPKTTPILNPNPNTCERGQQHFKSVRRNPASDEASAD